jgi:hypothetical protein
MQYFLEGSYDRQDVIEHIDAALDRAIEDALEKYAEKWRWKTDAEGNRTWKVVPGETEQYVRPEPSVDRSGAIDE